MYPANGITSDIKRKIKIQMSASAMTDVEIVAFELLKYENPPGRRHGLFARQELLMFITAIKRQQPEAT